MQEKDDKEPKHPTEMTSDELLDYVLDPKVSERVKRLAKDEPDPPVCEPDEVD